MQLRRIKEPMVVYQQYQSSSKFWSVSDGESLIEMVEVPAYEDGDYNSCLFEMWEDCDFQLAGAVACLSHDTVVCEVMTASEFCDRYAALRVKYPHFVSWAWDELLEHDAEVPIRYLVEFSRESTWVSRNKETWSYASESEAMEEAEALEEDSYGVVYRELAFTGVPIRQVTFGTDRKDALAWIDGQMEAQL